MKYYFHEQILLSKPTKELICYHFCDVVYFSEAQIEKNGEVFIILIEHFSVRYWAVK
jgi:hypothetical protein